MKYKVGDKVRIKSLDWYNENKDEFGQIPCKGFSFVISMTLYCDSILTIEEKTEDCYCVKENVFCWTDEMIEGLVEEEMSLDKAGQITDFEYEGLAYTLPEGYQFVDENGNVINATKIVLEKKKNEYPKTYEECCKVLGYDDRETYCIFHTGADETLFEALYNLKVCRDAYWKIAGAWKPEYPFNTARYVITNLRGFAGKVLVYDAAKNYILEFPTEEMRDAFYENFKDLIEECKELL